MTYSAHIVIRKTHKQVATWRSHAKFRPMFIIIFTQLTLIIHGFHTHS